MKESEIEAHLVKRVKELGGEVRKLKWVGRRGAPDRFVMVFGRSFFVELKAPGKKPSPQQSKEISVMREQGVGVWVLDSTDGVENALQIERIKAGR